MKKKALKEQLDSNYEESKVDLRNLEARLVAREDHELTQLRIRVIALEARLNQAINAGLPPSTSCEMAITKLRSEADQAIRELRELILNRTTGANLNSMVGNVEARLRALEITLEKTKTSSSDELSLLRSRVIVLVNLWKQNAHNKSGDVSFAHAMNVLVTHFYDFPETENNS